mmetsp:Transcript_35597/g.62899  ORF Transcript_35597/g.62899 Transcript_35597/m.62899 type:complete len:246 (+) Transcript_35597:105-842(+)
MPRSSRGHAGLATSARAAGGTPPQHHSARRRRAELQGRRGRGLPGHQLGNQPPWIQCSRLQAGRRNCSRVLRSLRKLLAAMRLLAVDKRWDGSEWISRLVLLLLSQRQLQAKSRVCHELLRLRVPESKVRFVYPVRCRTPRLRSESREFHGHPREGQRVRQQQLARLDRLHEPGNCHPGSVQSVSLWKSHHRACRRRVQAVLQGKRRGCLRTHDHSGRLHHERSRIGPGACVYTRPRLRGDVGWC